MTTHVFRVTCLHEEDCYREIEIPGGRSLYALAEAIIDAFDFDFDHAFGFYSALGEDYHGSEVSYELFADMGDAEPFFGGNGGNRPRSVKKTKIAQAFTEPGQTMQFLFDYGDDWRFEIRWIATGKQYKGKAYPVILASVGEAPEQYPDWDDDWDDEDEDDEEQGR
jgi:hypothetical protein